MNQVFIIYFGILITLLILSILLSFILKASIFDCIASNIIIDVIITGGFFGFTFDTNWYNAAFVRADTQKIVKVEKKLQNCTFEADKIRLEIKKIELENDIEIHMRRLERNKQKALTYKNNLNKKEEKQE